MLAAIDIGNTSTQVGVFDGDRMVLNYHTVTDVNRSLNEQTSLLATFFLTEGFEKGNVDKAIISSVVPSNTEMWSEISLNLFGVKAMVVGPGLKNGLRMKVDYPNEVGSDLVADCVGANALCGGAKLIVDMGTANKYLVIDDDQAFCGAVFTAGFKASLQALLGKAALLKDISIKETKRIIGKNTEDCLNSGLLHGAIHQIRGFRKDIENEMGKPLKLILTGGYGRVVRNYLDDCDYEPNLILLGLRKIADLNTK